MILSYFDFEEPISIQDKTSVIVIENPILFRNIITELTKQVSGMDGKFVLSNDKFEKLEISKSVDLTTDILNIGIDNKKLSTTINKSLVSLITSNHENEVQTVFQSINNFANTLVLESDLDISFDIIEDVPSLVKFISFYIDMVDLTFPEKVLTYMRIMTKLTKVQLFVFVGLKGVLSQDELLSLYKSISYEDYKVLLIENVDREHFSEYETNRIIDIDLCEV